jgi:hypothetical protein
MDEVNWAWLLDHFGGQFSAETEKKDWSACRLKKYWHLFILIWLINGHVISPDCFEIIFLETAATRLLISSLLSIVFLGLSFQVSGKFAMGGHCISVRGNIVHLCCPMICKYCLLFLLSLCCLVFVMLFKIKELWNVFVRQSHRLFMECIIVCGISLDFPSVCSLFTVTVR